MRSAPEGWHCHIEQKNFPQVWLWFGYERYEHPAVWPLINELCGRALSQLLNYFLPTMKLEKKQRIGKPSGAVLRTDADAR